jgi:hypothetical protein
LDGAVVLALGAAVALAGLWLAARRAITIAELEAVHGKLRVRRGGVAPPILADLRDVANSPPLDGVRIRIVRSSGRAAVEIVGAISEPQAQRIRNVVGSVPLARLINARRR